MELISRNKSEPQSARFMAALALVVLVSLVGIEPAMAQGLEKVNTALQNFLTFLRGVSIVVVTIAIIWGGYKMLYQRQSIGDVLPIFGGGLLIGCAAEIARFMLQ